MSLVINSQMNVNADCWLTIGTNCHVSLAIRKSSSGQKFSKTEVKKTLSKSTPFYRFQTFSRSYTLPGSSRSASKTRKKKKNAAKLINRSRKNQEQYVEQTRQIFETSLTLACLFRNDIITTSARIQFH